MMAQRYTINQHGAKTPPIKMTMILQLFSLEVPFLLSIGAG